MDRCARQGVREWAAVSRQRPSACGADRRQRICRSPRRGECATRRIGNEEAPRRSRHGETRKNRKIVEGENHLTRIKNVFQDSGERAYNAAIPFRGSGKCTWLLSIKMVLAPEKGRKGPRRPRARLPAHSALRWTRSGGRADGLLSADSVAKVPNCPALGRVLISGADRRFGCPKLDPQR